VVVIAANGATGPSVVPAARGANAAKAARPKPPNSPTLSSN
jgi:hypothetical protein